MYANLLFFKPYLFLAFCVGTTDFSIRRWWCSFDCVSSKWYGVVSEDSI
ncbi:Replicative DNA helicase, intein-containing [Mucinivorans hirudinis]|uniref:Replicative DNA helicase, intein-containing n=1 Tax=Mucinivorans hirudinis TaxID=1433126 RepID=A0A060R6D4_9BACT|nr:Replicative DNA helicase, intein-containing [Mucinivorans hirudinis]CDN30525.1 Replicative DNA helicase, intein-containing [Mucinivorans hirudinis]CDN30601.1 Replicative DNA helicase, intein-containing [Mucinivorans hirudinis]